MISKLNVPLRINKNMIILENLVQVAVWTISQDCVGVACHVFILIHTSYMGLANYSS